MKTSIWITTHFIGFHCWPDAPEAVSFLRNLHRHKFNVRVEVLVAHDDRQLEFFIFQNIVKGVLTRLVNKLHGSPHMSCEMMAMFIGDFLKIERFPLVSVSVDEDGENGAKVEYEETDEK